MPDLQSKIDRLKKAADKKLNFWKVHLTRKITKLEEKVDEKEIEIAKLKSQLLLATKQLADRESQLTETQHIIQNFERDKNHQSKPINSCGIAGALLRIMGDDSNFNDNFNTQTCWRGFKEKHVLRPGHKFPERKLKDFPITFKNITRDESQIFYDVTENEFHERLDSLWTTGGFGRFGTKTNSLLINNDYIAAFTATENGIDLILRKKHDGELVSKYGKIVHFEAKKY